MGVQLQVKAVKESSKEHFHSLSSIIEQMEANQLIIEMKAYDAINSTDMLLNMIKEGLHSLDTLQFDEVGKETKPGEESKPTTDSVKEGNSFTFERFKEIMKPILEAAYISNQVSRDIEHEIANQRDILDLVKCKLKHNSIIH